MILFKKRCYYTVIVIFANLKGWVNDSMNSCVYEMVMWWVREANPPMLDDLLSSQGNAC